ncbi:TPA: helix-turn-helix domain-containing protein [Aeromonas dhakensis]|nr:helix-turn-helix domain-containing protein [Aeromonas dhakensis]HDZ8911327.1 helix-turn-helix domain-containing protein [Aeromonas dhakensis]
MSPALSVQLKEKRDAAILEKHKEGMSNRAIAKLFNMGSRTVDEVVKEVRENPESGNLRTPEVSTSAVPMASTEDRSETREDAPLRKKLLEQISKSDPRTA